VPKVRIEKEIKLSRRLDLKVEVKKNDENQKLIERMDIRNDGSSNRRSRDRISRKIQEGKMRR